MIILRAIMAFLTPASSVGGGFIGPLRTDGSFAQGGIIPKAAGGMVVGGNYPSGDRMLIAANSGEMILNGTQQAKLFNMINNGGYQKIEVTGNLRAESNEFVGGFNKAVNVYNKNVKGRSIGR